MPAVYDVMDRVRNQLETDACLCISVFVVSCVGRDLEDGPILFSGTLRHV